MIWGINCRYEGDWAIGNSNYIHIMFDTFAHFTTLFPWVCLVLVIIYKYISSELCILPLHLNYIYVFTDMFVHLITVSVLLFLCMLYNIIVGYNLSWCFVITLSCACVITPLSHCYICVCIDMFVSFISMATSICLCNSYNMILGCSTSWTPCHEYLLYMICYAVFNPC